MTSVTLTITYSEAGVRIEGPIADKILCYGLLESARDAIRDFTAPKEESAIMLPDTKDVLAFNGRRK